MPMLFKENVSLAPYTTIGVGGPARLFCEAASEADVEQAVTEAASRGMRLFVLGGGSNLLVDDDGFDGLVMHVASRGISEPEPGLMDVAAGEEWDEFVRLATSKGYAGIECLAGIPGTVGGTPVQNVGAYGQEVATTITCVRAFDRTTTSFVELNRKECRFRYRQSIFNTSERDRYIVTRVQFRLRPGEMPTLAYADLQRYFIERKDDPSLTEVADGVREIRRKKGMVVMPGDPDSRSAGSFFKNPVVPVEQVTKVAAAAGIPEWEIPKWPAGAGIVKLPAAWLLEQAGFHKGFAMGRAAVSSKHTLALTNRGGATFAEIDALAKVIVDGVQAKFGVLLEREPVLLA